MSNESPSVIDPTIFATVFEENWENARHIKSQRISFMNAYSLIGLFTSLRLKGELEECLAKIEAMSVQAKMNAFVAIGQLEGESSRYPRFRWIFPIFYSMTTAGFVALIVHRLVGGGPIR